MTTAEIKQLLKEMADAGVFFLTLSGGEIFLRKDFFEILEWCPRSNVLHQAQDQCGAHPRGSGGAPARPGRRVHSDQHLFAPSGSARRDYEDFRFTAALN